MTDTAPAYRPGKAAKADVRAFLVELMHFTQKEARACLFAGLFFLSVFLVPRAGLPGIPRYDLLLIIALAIQGWLLWTGRESLDEAKAICVFHVLGFALEVFKTSSGIKSWSYPDFAIGTFFGLWAYPHQLGAWATVHMSKWSAWSLLVLMSFTIVTNLKHVKATVHVPE